MQKRLFDIGWSNESKCQACHKEEGTTIVQVGMKSGAKSQRLSGSGSRKRELQRKGKKKKGVTHLPSEHQRNRGHFSMNKWESEKH